MASAGTVTVDFAAETAKFTAELKKVQGSLSRLEGNFKSVEKVAKFALNAFSAGALVAFAKQAFNAADATATAAERAGIAVESFSRLQYAAGQADIEMAALATGVQKFQIAISNASAGSKTAQGTLAEFGLQAEKIKNLRIEDQLAQVADAFSKLSNPADKTRLAVELFGKAAGPQLVPLLSQGREGIAAATRAADQLGITMSATTAAGIDQADQAIKTFLATLQGAAQRSLATLSIAVLGAPNEIVALEQQIESLKQQRDEILFSDEQGVGAGFAIYRRRVDEINVVLLQLESRLKSIRDLQAGVAQSSGPGSRRPDVSVLPFSEIDLAPIQALKIEVDELSIAYANLATAAANAPIDRMHEISNIVGAEFADAQRQFQQQLSDDLFAHLEARTAAEEAAAAYRVDLEKRTSEAILQTKAATTNAALGLLQALGVKNKAFAVAAIVLEKGLAIQRLLMQNQIAAELAFASQLIPAVPASLATASAAKAAVLAQGRLGAVLIGATGALQIADRFSSRPSAIGTPLNPAYTTSVNDPMSQDVGASAVRAVQVVFNGPVFNNEETKRYIVDAIREAVDDSDVIIIGPNSRQAQELVGG